MVFDMVDIKVWGGVPSMRLFSNLKISLSAKNIPHKSECEVLL
jgi:hypothetical protein